MAQFVLKIEKLFHITEVVYHLPKKSGNFSWNVNGKIHFVFPNGNFLGKTGFLERQTKISEWKMCVPLVSFYWFRAFWLEKVVEMERTCATENFHLGFDAYHLLRLLTNLFSE